MIQINRSNWPIIASLFTQGKRVVLVPTSETVPRGITRYGHYEVTGLDEEKDPGFKDDGGANTHIDVKCMTKFRFRASIEGMTEEEFQAYEKEYMANRAGQLSLIYELRQKAMSERFSEGDLITFSHKLMADRRQPGLDEPALFVRYFDEPMTDPNQGMNNAAFTFYDCEIGVICPSGEFITWPAESWRYKPYEV